MRRGAPIPAGCWPGRAIDQSKDAGSVYTLPAHGKASPRASNSAVIAAGSYGFLGRAIVARIGEPTTLAELFLVEIHARESCGGDLGEV